MITLDSTYSWSPMCSVSEKHNDHFGTQLVDRSSGYHSLANRLRVALDLKDLRPAHVNHHVCKLLHFVWGLHRMAWKIEKKMQIGSK